MNMSNRSWEKFFSIGIICGIIIFILFFPAHETVVNNETMFSTFVGFKLKDGSIFTALLIGIATILTTLYTTERSYKIMRLSSIPDKSTNLLLNLEFEFNEYDIYKQKNRADEIILFIRILKYWREHQKAFRLLAPMFYKDFVDFISTPEIINKRDQNFEKNSKYVINAILTQITNIALEKDNETFYFLNPSQIKDFYDIKQKGNMKHCYIEIKLDKNNLNEYITEINGEKTRICCIEKFEKLCNKICFILNTLKIEIEDYD